VIHPLKKLPWCKETKWLSLKKVFAAAGKQEIEMSFSCSRRETRQPRENRKTS
jgi:hypothetical protein